MTISKPKHETNPSDTIFAWWRDQPLGNHELKLEMRAFDRLSKPLRDVCNECRLNVLPRTVERSIKLWGEAPTVAALKALDG